MPSERKYTVMILASLYQAIYGELWSFHHHKTSYNWNLLCHQWEWNCQLAWACGKNEGWKFVQHFGTSCLRPWYSQVLMMMKRHNQWLPVLITLIDLLICGATNSPAIAGSCKSSTRGTFLFRSSLPAWISESHNQVSFLQNVVSGILIESGDGVVMVVGLKPWLWVRKGVPYCYQLWFNMNSLSPKIKIIKITCLLYYARFWS